MPKVPWAGPDDPAWAQRAIAVVAPLSTLLVRTAGINLTVGAGPLIVAGGLWQLSTATAAW